MLGMRKVLITVRPPERSDLQTFLRDLLAGSGVEVYRVVSTDGADKTLSCRVPIKSIEKLRHHPRVVRLEVEGEAPPPRPTDDHGRWEDDGGRAQN
jgi:hypothetical protein